MPSTRAASLAGCPISAESHTYSQLERSRWPTGPNPRADYPHPRDKAPYPKASLSAFSAASLRIPPCFGAPEEASGISRQAGLSSAPQTDSNPLSRLLPDLPSAFRQECVLSSAHWHRWRRGWAAVRTETSRPPMGLFFHRRTARLSPTRSLCPLEGPGEEAGPLPQHVGTTPPRPTPYSPRGRWQIGLVKPDTSRTATQQTNRKQFCRGT